MFYFDFINGSIPIAVRQLPIKAFYYLFNKTETKLLPNHNGNVTGRNEYDLAANTIEHVRACSIVLAANTVLAE